jgi:hypothetical protein
LLVYSYAWGGYKTADFRNLGSVVYLLLHRNPFVIALWLLVRPGELRQCFYRSSPKNIFMYLKVNNKVKNIKIMAGMAVTESNIDRHIC